MTKDMTDRERVWTDTQEWLDDLDRDGADAESAVPAADLAAWNATANAP